MPSRRKYIIASVITVMAFIAYAACYFLLDLSLGLRSVWPGFVFLFAVCYYLLSNPLSEEKDA